MVVAVVVVVGRVVVLTMVFTPGSFFNAEHSSKLLRVVPPDD